MKRLEEEIVKQNPSTSVLKELMARTCRQRNSWIRNTNNTPMLQEIFSKVPFLKKSAYVCFTFLSVYRCMFYFSQCV